jgi:hypothetical protein
MGRGGDSKKTRFEEKVRLNEGFFRFRFESRRKRKKERKIQSFSV